MALLSTGLVENMLSQSIFSSLILSSLAMLAMKNVILFTMTHSNNVLMFNTVTLQFYFLLLKNISYIALSNRNI